MPHSKGVEPGVCVFSPPVLPKPIHISPRAQEKSSASGEAQSGPRSETLDTTPLRPGPETPDVPT